MAAVTRWAGCRLGSRYREPGRASRRERPARSAAGGGAAYPVHEVGSPDPLRPGGDPRVDRRVLSSSRLSGLTVTRRRTICSPAGPRRSLGLSIAATRRVPWRTCRSEGLPGGGPGTAVPTGGSGPRPSSDEATPNDGSPPCRSQRLAASGSTPPSAVGTFAAWVEEWSATVVDLRPSTRDRDLRAVRVHLIPRFGCIALARITNPMVRAFIADMLRTGEHSPATVRKVGQILAKVMRGAVNAGLIARSPCDGVRLPAEERREMRFLSRRRGRGSRDGVGAKWEALIYTAAYAGLRWGELAGLRHQRVEIERRTIVVVEQLNELSARLSCGRRRPRPADAPSQSQVRWRTSSPSSWPGRWSNEPGSCSRRRSASHFGGRTSPAGCGHPPPKRSGWTVSGSTTCATRLSHWQLGRARTRRRFRDGWATAR